MAKKNLSITKYELPISIRKKDKSYVLLGLVTMYI